MIYYQCGEAGWWQRRNSDTGKAGWTVTHTGDDGWSVGTAGLASGIYSADIGQSLQVSTHMTHQVMNDQGALLPGTTHPWNWVRRRLINCYTHLSGGIPVSNIKPRSTTPVTSLPAVAAGHSTGSAPAPAPGGSQPCHSSVENDLSWQRLRSDRMRWDPNAPEPLRPDGESILMNFTLRMDNKIYCRVPTQGGCCNYPNVKKERLLHHMRKDHLNFFPFVCGGSCRSRSWYVIRCLR